MPSFLLEKTYQLVCMSIYETDEIRNTLVMVDFMIAALGGVIGTALMTGLMLFGKQLHLPAIDAHGILGYMLKSDRATALGYVMHWVNGIIFAIGYAIVLRMVAGNLIMLGVILGTMHWLGVGWMFAYAPLVHAGMKAGTVDIPGAYMLRSLGFVGFIAGLIGHIVFGVSVVLIYALLGGTLAIG